MPAKKFIETAIMTPEIKLLHQNWKMGYGAGQAHEKAKYEIKIAKLQEKIVELKAKQTR